MARDRQQAMTAARLAELRAEVSGLQAYREHGKMTIDRHISQMEEMLADNERLRAALTAKSDSYERLHLINVWLVSRSRAQKAALVEVARAVAEATVVLIVGQHRTDYLDPGRLTGTELRAQARAVLASTKAEAGEQAAQGEA